MRKFSRCIFFFVLSLVGLSIMTGCSAPSAELYEGPIVDELREGMESGDSRFDHSDYDALLTDYVDVDEGTVDYAGLSEKRSRLDGYLSSIADADLESLGTDEQLALLLNAYNAYTLELILDYYPEIDSIRDISDPWTTERFEVGGHTLSLDQIEHQLIRPLYRDSRIHFAVNCAARDCPFLADFAYTGSEVDEQLSDRTEAILSHSRFVRVEDQQLRYTRVMHWYEDDFVNDSFKGHAPNIAQYIARYTTDGVRGFIENHDGDPPASALDYDWSLNDSGR